MSELAYSVLSLLNHTSLGLGLCLTVEATVISKVLW